MDRPCGLERYCISMFQLPASLCYFFRVEKYQETCYLSRVVNPEVCGASSATICSTVSAVSLWTSLRMFLLLSHPSLGYTVSGLTLQSLGYSRLRCQVGADRSSARRYYC